MSKEITAAVVEKIGEPFHVETLYVDDAPKAGEVLVHMVASGICHSDEAVRNGTLGEMNFPMVAGHEGAGIVEKVGDAVTGIQPGDHVVLSYDYCGACDYCLSGQPASCENWGLLNFVGKRPDGSTAFTKADGTPVSLLFNQSSFSTTTLTQAHNVTVIDKDIDLRKVGPLGCGFVTGSGTVLNTLKPAPGASIAVFGTGAVGSAALMAAKIAGCTTIISVDINPDRLAMALKLGATDIVNSKGGDPVEAIMGLTGGKGVDYTVDTTGISAVMRQALDALAINGTFAPVAVSQQELTFSPFNDLLLKQQHMVGVVMGNAVPQITIKQLVEFWQKGMYPFDLLEKTFKFADINAANAASIDGSVIKPVLIMDESYRP